MGRHRIQLPHLRKLRRKRGVARLVPPYGGTGDVVCSILNPDNPPIDLPEWVCTAGRQSQTAAPAATSRVDENALRRYDGEVVMVPMFDWYCVDDPDVTQEANPPLFGCPDDDTGGGTTAWYHFPSFAYLQLCSSTTPGCNVEHGAYIHGAPDDECNIGGNGATSCIIGKFVEVKGTERSGREPVGERD